jgi:catechol 2,3-dioxygenase-like lactoylglutathione lyase family enzyme
MNHSSLWQMEAQFWHGGADFYHANLTDDALMAFPEPAGVLDRRAAIDSISTAPRWTTVRFEQRHAMNPNPGRLVAARGRGLSCAPNRRQGLTMLDHVSIPVGDLPRSAAFYDAVLDPLGLIRRKEGDGALGFGPVDRPAPVFWLLAKRDSGAAAPGIGLHISFQAATAAAVDAFHAAAMRLGGTDAGRPGVRPEYTMPFYGAFVLDPDGFKIEAVCRNRPAGRTDACR